MNYISDFYKKEEWIKSSGRRLKILGEYMSSTREEHIYKERQRRDNKKYKKAKCKY